MIGSTQEALFQLQGSGKLKQKIRRRKAGVSAVIGTVIMFSILFTVGFGYFYSITQGQQIYQKTVQSMNSGVIQESEESLVLTPSVANNILQITVNNTGITATINGYWIINNTLTQYLTGAASNPPLPYVVGQGKYVTLSGGNYMRGSQYLIKVLTSRGSIFTAVYPPTAVSLASQALSSGALGDIYIAFNSYTYYNITTSNCPLQGQSVGSSGTSSGYCLSSGLSAFTIPASDPYSVAFGITMTNLNSAHNSIVLDQYTLLYEAFPHENSNLASSFEPWFVVSNETSGGSNVILEDYSPITLPYNAAVTVVFGAANCVPESPGPNVPGNSCVAVAVSNSPLQLSPFTLLKNLNPGFATTVFIMSHGWELQPPVSISSLSYSGANYGQNLPYVSTLYI